MKRFILGAALSALAFAWTSPAAADDDAKAPKDAAHAHLIAEARATVGTMEGAARAVAELLWKARRTQDARAIACTNESLSEADVLTRRARVRIGWLQDALIRGDDEDAVRILALIHDDRALQRRVSKQAFECVGVTTVSSGRDVTTVRLIVSKDIPPDTGT